MGFVKNVGHLALTTLASLLLIFLGVIYFMITVFMVKFGAQLAGISGIGGSTYVLAAGIITAAAILGSAIQK